ncbi:hypothetical protein NBH00_06965 [Paraconexibacter antarcticus]|uniref:Uncharacterized protein n=1 Tax=Paraconexibacter antarcticus TaxID=2949664 RepID=A0ABY5DWM4_9ACTN|nr:hypothetical protein [Paraconexibacter antarcticus]UTI65944.1 hypothetical protein NBH00_06965 [Paraconexibacter antarcticus]
MKEWIAAQRRGEELVVALASAFARRDDAGIAALAQRIDRLAEVNARFARRYGIEGCVRATG